MILRVLFCSISSYSIIFLKLVYFHSSYWWWSVGFHFLHPLEIGSPEVDAGHFSDCCWTAAVCFERRVLPT